MDTRAVVTHRPKRLVTSLVAAFLMLMVIFAASLYLYIAKNITLIIDGEVTVSNTMKSTVGEFLDEEGIVLYPEDAINYALDQKLEHQDTINITRSFDIYVDVDGERLSIRSIPITAGEVLDDLDVTLSDLDEVSLPLDQLVTESQAIQVARINERYGSVREAIEPSIERREDYTLEKGITRIIQNGKEGLLENTIKVTEKDGVEISREVVDSIVVKDATPEIIAYGVISVASREGVTFDFEKAMVVTATAYTATGHRTSTGTTARVGVIAVDPGVIPLGSKVYVENYGFAYAEDVGSSIKGNKIDVYLDSESACYSWGVKTVKIYILED